MATARQEKVNSLLQREIGWYLQSQGFEEITGLVTITAVETTADLEQARVFVAVVGQKEEDVLKILQAHVYEIQGMLYRRFNMRMVPRIRFAPDKSGAHAARLSEVMRSLHSKNDHANLGT